MIGPTLSQAEPASGTESQKSTITTPDKEILTLLLDFFLLHAPPCSADRMIAKIIVTRHVVLIFENDAVFCCFWKITTKIKNKDTVVTL